MRKLVHLLAPRYDQREDENSVIRDAIDRFHRNAQPILEAAVTDPDQFSSLESEIGELQSGLLAGAYIDGICDLIHLLSYKGGYKEIIRGFEGGDPR